MNTLQMWVKVSLVLFKRLHRQTVFFLDFLGSHPDAPFNFEPIYEYSFLAVLKSNKKTSLGSE